MTMGPIVIGRIVKLMVIAALAGCLSACASVGLRNPVPSASLAQTATLPSLPAVRWWADEVPTNLREEIRRRLPHAPMSAVSDQRINGRPVVNILALSGGGPDGAFGAGLLNGWTAHGDRPRFEIVTGVSAGALIAPFAFLGPRYDVKLQELWTQYQTTQLVTSQILPGLLGGSSLADTKPLAELIAKYVDRKFLREIAAEYRKGRLLLVGTTNLDAQRPVVWNMGEIAYSNDTNALALFRDVLLASAAIPGAFPPVNIDVEVDGFKYEEMHVDGGTTRELFVAPVQVPFRQFDKFFAERTYYRLFIVKNGKFRPQYEPVMPQTVSIAARAISTLIIAQARGDVYKIYREALDSGVDFNLLEVPASFDVKPKEAFDPDYQKALFDEGYRLGQAGPPWAKVPLELTPQGSRPRT